MTAYASMIRSLTMPSVTEQLIHLYGSRDGMVLQQVSRYTKLLKRHEECFQPQGDIVLVSAPGRTEIGGNHTDHNRGRVLAASINLDTVAAASPRPDNMVHMYSGNYPEIVLDLSDLEKRPSETGRTSGLIRGVAARMAQLGYRIGGFDAAVTSTVFSGSGLSSSAAFEVMVSAIFDRLYNDFSMDFVTRAQVGQFAENVYFGKPSGLLDQMASAAGGLVTVDFKHEEPAVKRISFDFARNGYAIVVVAAGGDHASLTPFYAAIPAEMKAVAKHFGEDCLRRVRREEFEEAIPQLRKEAGDRAVLRAMHFYQENERVQKQVSALERDDLPAFMDAIIASGRSSFMYLQNVYATPDNQNLSLALAMAEEMLAGRGAWRVHGGGFAGTTLNFVPVTMLEDFTARMNTAFGDHACTVLDIRPEGAAELKL